MGGRKEVISVMFFVEHVVCGRGQGLGVLGGGVGGAWGRCWGRRGCWWGGRKYTIFFFVFGTR